MFPLGAEVDVSVLSNATSSSWEPGYAAVRGLVGFLSPKVYISLLASECFPAFSEYLCNGGGCKM